MKKLLLPFAIASVLAGCGSPTEETVAKPESGKEPMSASTPASPATPASAQDQVVGIWKVDFDKTTMPELSADDKAEGESLRLEIKADGTYSSKTSKDESSGTWKLDGGKVTFTPEKEGNEPPEMTLSEDGSTLTATMTQDDKTHSIVMVKA